MERSTPLFGEGAVTFADLGFETRNVEGAGTISSFYNFSLEPVFVRTADSALFCVVRKGVGIRDIIGRARARESSE